MTAENCILALQNALGESASVKDVEKLYDDIKKTVIDRATALAREQKMPLSQTFVIDAARRIGDETRTQSFIAKRTAAIQAAADARNAVWIENTYGLNKARGIEAIMSGVVSDRAGTRDGAMQRQQGLRKDWRAGMQRDLQDAGVWKLIREGDKAFDESVFKAMHDMGTEKEAETFARMGPQAKAVAETFRKWLNHGRLMANDAGAWIGELDNYAGRNTHNAELIRHMEEPAYTALLRDTLDIDAMMAKAGAVDEAKFLHDKFQHQAFDVHDTPPNPYIGDVGMQSTAKAISHSRVFIFKDADAAWRYSQAAGGTSFKPTSLWGVKWENNQSLLNAITRQLDSMAEATGFMQKLGPNGSASMEKMVNDTMPKRLMLDGSAQAIKENDKLKAQSDFLLNKLLPNINGEATGVANQSGARIMQSFRNWQSLVSLGGMLFSQFSDAVQHMEGSHYWGRGWLAGLHDVGVGLTTNFKNNPFARELASSFGVMVDHFGGEIARAGSGDVSGSISKTMQLFWKINGANWWNTHMEYAAAHGNAHFMASFAGKEHGELPPELQRVLGQYGIKAADWDAMRAAPLVDRGDGKLFMVPDGMAPDVAAKYKTLMIDQTSHSQLEPDAKTRAYMLQGSKAGTVGGESLRSAMQFKAFTMAFTQKTLGRTLFGHGFEHEGGMWTDAAKAMMRPNEFTGMVQIFMLTTGFGYLSQVTKDAVMRNLAPQNPMDMDKSQLAKLFMASAMQGGGMGLLSDLFFSQSTRAGGGLADTMLGPLIGRLTSADKMAQDLRDQAIAGNLHPALAEGAYRALVGAIPGNNLFWFKGAFDYYANDMVREWLNPGTIYRQDERVERDKGQHRLPWRQH